MRQHSRETAYPEASDAQALKPDILATILRPSMFWLPERVAPSGWTQHVPFAFWLVDVLRPARIVELGTHSGVSYSAMCQAVKALSLPTSCFAVDTWKGDEHAGLYPESVFEEFGRFHDAHFNAFSRLVRSTFDEALPHFEDRSVDLLHIDGLHTYEAVRHDVESWRPKLSSNAVLLLHDINVREGSFGVAPLWSELSAGHQHFEFLHGHGLGIVCLGSNYPAALQFLLDASSDGQLASAIRDLFSYLGRSVAASGQLLESERQMAMLHGEAAAREARIAELGEALAAQVADVGVTLAARNSRLATLEGELVSRSREYDALQKKISEQDANIAARERAIAVLSRDLEGLRLAAAERESNLRDVEDALAARSRELAALEQMLAWRDDEIAALKRSVTENVHESRAHRAALTQARTGLADLQRAIAALEGSRSWRITSPLRFLATLPKRFAADLRRRSDISVIAQSSLFDGEWYLARNPDVAAQAIDPILHYVVYGAPEGRNPGPQFDGTRYLRENDDVRAAGLNPLVHYIEYGAAEGRKIYGPEPPAQCGSLPLSRLAIEAIQTGISPLADIRAIAQSGLFDEQWYLERNRDVATQGIDPIAHYIAYGAGEGRNPGPLFDGERYLRDNLDGRSAGLNPLLHYIRHGAAEGLKAHPLESPSKDGLSTTS